MPGVPDFYQGTEFWDLSLVDPDNRRPVDFAARESAFPVLSASPDWPSLAAHWRNGEIKMALTQQLLAWRKACAAVFTYGDYRPLPVTGAHSEHVLAFARILRRDAAVIIVGRHFAPLSDEGSRWPSANDWDGAVLFDGLSILRNRLQPDRPLAAGSAPLAELFGSVPVACLDAHVSGARMRA